MAKICPNFEDPGVLRDFEEIEGVLGSDLAYYMWSKNEGNPLYQTKDGETSKLFNELSKRFGNSKAIEIKANMYVDSIPFSETSVDELGEPTINQFERFFPKNEYHKNIQNPTVGVVQNFNKLPAYNFGVIPNGATKVIDENRNYIPEFQSASAKRTVANRFFRYFHANGKKSAPFYPYRYSSDLASNQKYARYINEHFDRNVVVTKNDGSIVFTENVNDAQYTGLGNEQSFNEPSQQPLFNDLGNMNEESSGMFNLTPEEQKLADENAKKKKVSDEKKTIIDQTIFGLENRKSRLDKRVAKGGGTSTMRANLTAINVQIAKLNEEKKISTSSNVLKDMASQDAKMVANGFQTISENMDNIEDLAPEEILKLTDSLVSGSEIIKGWIYIQEMDEHRKEPLMEELRTLSQEYKDLNADYNDMLAELFTAYANKVSFRNDFSKSDIVKAIDDISPATANLMNIGSSGVDLLKVVDDIINKANFTINEERITKEAELKRQEKKLNEAGYSKKQVNEVFKQKYNGKWTGNIIGRIGHDFYATKNKLKGQVFSKKIPNSKYRTWLKENTKHFNVKNLNDILTGDFKSSEKLGYSKQELDAQQELLKKYIQDETAHKELMEAKYGEDSKIGNEEQRDWQRDNSPKMFIQGENNAGERYLLDPKPIDKWKDKAFEQVQNTPALLEFYKFLEGRFTENNKELGYFNEFNEFYLPELEDSLLERIKTQEGLRKKVSMIANEGVQALTDELENINDIGDNIGGRIMKSVPIHMMADRIPAAFKDGDIFRVANSHTEMALNYKYKTQIEPMTNAATDLLDSMDEVKTLDQDGVRILKNLGGTIWRQKGQLVETKKLLEYAKDALIYGKRKSIEGTIKEVKAVEYVEDPKTGEIVKEDVQKRVTGSALADTLISYTYLKAMSFPNLVTPAVNMLFGINSNLIYAAGGEDFDLKTYRQVLPQMMAITARSFGGESNIELVNKTFAFMEKFEIIGDIHDSSYGKKRSVSEKMTFLQGKAELFVQGSTMMSMLKYQKLKDSKGKEISIFDAYTWVGGELIWDVDKMGPQQEVPNDRVIAENGRSINEVKFGAYIDRVNAKISGNYKDPMMAKKSAIGRTLSLFKTWLPEAINHRFGKETIDYDLLTKEGKLGRQTKGRYRSYLKSTTQNGIDVTFAQTIGMLLKGIVSKKAFNQLSEVDRVNMLRNLKEIQQIALVYLTAAIMKGLLMDDDDEAKPLLNLAINTLTKSGADLSFFVSPNSASQVLDNLVPVASTLKDIQRAVSAAGKVIQGDVYVKSGPQEGYNRVLVGGARTIPGFSSGIKMWNLGSKVIEAGR